MLAKIFNSRLNMNRRTKVILTEYVPLIIAFISTVLCAIIFKQDLVKTIPVCFSLVIVLLSARANKICYLLGATNCLIYIAGYLMEGLYGSFLQTFFSAVMQFATFFYWKKNSYKHATKFRKMSVLFRILLVIVILVLTVIAVVTLKNLNGKEVFLDAFTLVLGIVGPILTLFAFMEYLPLAVLAQALTLIMWIKITVSGSIANITYVILSLYNTYMMVRLSLTWIKLYKEQKTLDKKAN